MTFSQATLEGGVAPALAHSASSPVSTGELGAVNAQAKGSDGGTGATRFHLPVRAQDRHSSSLSSTLLLVLRLDRDRGQANAVSWRRLARPHPAPTTDQAAQPSSKIAWLSLP